MAITGPGNFDSDAAHDVLAFLLEDIVKTIRETFTYDTENSLYGDVGEAFIMANIDLILTLCNHYKQHPTLWQLDEVREWKTNYLKTFDKTIHLYNPSSGYVEKRRKVIAETFDKLYDLVVESGV